MAHRYLRLNIPTFPYQQALGELAFQRLSQLGAKVHLMDDGLIDMETNQPDIDRHLFQLRSGRADVLVVSARHLPLHLPPDLCLAGAMPGSSRYLAALGNDQRPTFFVASDAVSAAAYKGKHPECLQVHPLPSQSGFPTAYGQGFGAKARVAALSELELVQTPEPLYRRLPTLIGAPGTGHWAVVRRAEKEPCSWMADAIVDPVTSFLVQLERRLAHDVYNLSGQLAGVRISCLQRNKLKVELWVPGTALSSAITYRRVIPYSSPYLVLGQIMRELHKKGLPTGLPSEVL